ncbi:formylglycine-generating enzyme family protein [Kribbella catacumbae]|uniref:formylglycine-generating enzyme family protein n=1 Tax=Kribbella catacumbae TaxID=460086 RepID=UPI000370319E|nr:SUMF1/EgtB/PvdO family nonheme iron enzyme [Kribbella catacumbae]
MSIGAIFIAPTTYRNLPAIGWAAHGDVQAELLWQLGQRFDSKIIVIGDRRLGSPAAARRAVDDARKALDGRAVLLVCLAGHVVEFARRDGLITALALPGSVSGRPTSMLRIDELSAALRLGEGKPVIVCADLVSPRDTAGTVAPAFTGAFVLASRSAADAWPESTCHDALAAVLGGLAASGTEQSVPQLLDVAQQRIVAAGGRPHLTVCASPAVVRSRFIGEQLPDYVREDLSSPDPGSRLDAVTELAALAPSTPFARDSLLRLATRDRAEAVRGYADTMSRQDRQPSLRQLLTGGVVPCDIHEAALKEPAVPELLPHGGGDVVLGVDAPDGQDDCRPRHSVRLQPYRLARTVVTNRQYLAFLAAEGGPCPDHWQADNSLWLDDLPVVMVSWLDASRYCAWLTRHWHHTGALAPGQRITLPSEAEWEAAASNGYGQRHPWGDIADPRRANIRATGIGAVVASGQFSPQSDNEPGCQDLIGNVWEWTRSLWGHSGHQPTFGYPYQPDDGREAASTRPGGRYVIRGGAFYYATECANSFTRNRMLATDRHPAGGFRVASTSAGKKKS